MERLGSLRQRGIEHMIRPLLSHKRQNGPEIKYYLEPFCPLRKGILLLVREVDSRWNHFVPSLYLMHRKLADLGVALEEGKVCYFAEVGASQ